MLSIFSCAFWPEGVFLRTGRRWVSSACLQLAEDLPSRRHHETLLWMNTINSMQVIPGRWSVHLFHPHACLHNELSVPRKLARKRKETMSSTRQEMTVMVSSMDKSYAEQGTSCDEAFSFMDTHNLNGRCECCAAPAFGAALGFPGFHLVPGVRKQNPPENSQALLVSPVPSDDAGHVPTCHGCLGTVMWEG